MLENYLGGVLFLLLKKVVIAGTNVNHPHLIIQYVK